MCARIDTMSTASPLVLNHLPTPSSPARSRSPPHSMLPPGATDPRVVMVRALDAGANIDTSEERLLKPMADVCPPIMSTMRQCRYCDFNNDFAAMAKAAPGE